MIFFSRFLKPFLVSLFFSISLLAGIQSPTVSLSMGSFAHDDDITATKSCTVVCREGFTGKGRIKSPVVHITTKKFQFTGVIECDGDCFITAQESFNQKMFKRKGRGKFHITIDPTLAFDGEKKAAPTNDIEKDITSINKEIDALRSPIASPASFEEDRNVSKEITIEDCVFTLKGTRNIELADAIKQGDLVKAKDLLEKHQAVKKSKHDLSIFMVMAGLSGHIALAEEFIRLGADVNGWDQDSDSRFFRHFTAQKHVVTAAIAKKADFVSLLLEAGAEPNACNKDGLSILTIAVLQNDLATLKALVKSPKIDLNIRDRYRYTALMRAAHDGRAEMVQILLDAEADASISVAGGYTAADYARAEGHYEIEKLLRQKKA